MNYKRVFNLTQLSKSALRLAGLGAKKPDGGHYFVHGLLLLLAYLILLSIAAGLPVFFRSF